MITNYKIKKIQKEYFDTLDQWQKLHENRNQLKQLQFWNKIELEGKLDGMKWLMDNLGIEFKRPSK